jgi:protein involved in polysaccharide export with SLBB domain
MKMNKFLIYLSIALISSCSINCANVNSLTPSDLNTSELVEESAKESRTEYLLQVGDAIDIKFFYNSELNESVIIRPDGKISLQLIDEVVAAGLTPSELDGVLTDKYSQRLRYAEVAVIVKEFAGLRVYVGGEVNATGLIPMRGELTVLQAILQAGGYKDTAELKNVVILRNKGTQDPLFISLNLKQDLTTRTANNDILLKPCDIVFVPKTSIAKLGEFVDQYVNELVPAALSFGIVYNLNPELKVD